MVVEPSRAALHATSARTREIGKERTEHHVARANPWNIETHLREPVYSTRTSLDHSITNSTLKVSMITSLVRIDGTPGARARSAQSFVVEACATGDRRGV